MDRCSAISHVSAEPLAGTAPSTRAWLLVEQPGPWAPKPPAGCGFSDEVAAHLTALQERGIRLQLIRRHTRQPGARDQREGGPKRLFLAETAGGAPRLRRGIWREDADLLERTADELLGGAPLSGLEEHGEPLILVCTHAKRDACCAVAGRDAATALEQRFGDRVWETTHLGGHRFAANVFVLPPGLMFGRLSGQTAPDVIARCLAGELAAEFFRGRAHQDHWSQAAEAFTRRNLGLRMVEDVTTTVEKQEEEQALVSVATPIGRYRLTLAQQQLGEPRPLSCGKDAEDPGEIVLLAFEPETA